MHIVLVLKSIVVVFLAAVLARAGRAVFAWHRDDRNDDIEPVGLSRTTWRGRLALLITLVVAIGLVACELGGYYFFLDPAGGQWTVYGHGWPLINQQEILGLVEFNGDAELMVYLFALTVDLLLALAIMVATVAVLDRLLAHSRPGRQAVERPARRRALFTDLGGLLAALAVVLVLDNWLATPVAVPGTERVLLFASVSQEMWYMRGLCLAGLTAAAFMAGVLTSRGLVKLVRLRDEGVI